MRRKSRLLVIGLMACLALIVVVPTARSLWRDFAPVYGAPDIPSQSELLTLDQLDNALKSYEMRYGERPTGRSMGQIRQHLARTFDDVAALEKRLLYAGLELDAMDNRELLVFWLGGYREEDAQLRFPNRVNPGHSEDPLYDFPMERLVDVDNDGWLEFIGMSTFRKGVFVLTEGRSGILDTQTGATLTLDSIASRH